MQSWMFLSSFEDLRRKLLDSSSIETMAHLGAGAFDSIGGEVVSTTAFTLKNGFSSGNGTYIRLVNVSGDDNQSNACINAIKGDVDYRFEVSQHEFAQIPGSPIVYWLSEDVLSLFSLKILMIFRRNVRRHLLIFIRVYLSNLIFLMYGE